jgi:sterol desaturase/sphingolipid hydroxylase (fatty acid hydroxylase superfamily)
MAFFTFYPPFDHLGPPIVFGLLLLLIILESWRPLRRRVRTRFDRHPTNFAVAGVGFLVIRLALIPVVVFVAAWAHTRGFGLVKLLPAPGWLQAAVAFLLLDYTMYAWHRLNHRVPALWRFHNVHHTDLDLDVTTALRFHFGELVMSIAVRSAQVALVGAGPVLVLVYEIALEAATEFHHSNLRLPIGLERVLNVLFVTPRMHGIHHSVLRGETDSNYSNMFSFWDRLHRTARLNVPQEAITVGVPAYRDPAELTFFGLLLMPFRRQRDWPGEFRTGRNPNGDKHRLAE